MPPIRSQYEELEDNDFPAGPTLLLEDTETACQIYANTVEGVVAPDDDVASTGVLAMVIDADESTLETSTLDFDPDLMSTTTVTFVTATSANGDGTFAVGNHGTLGIAQIAGVNCDDDADEPPYLEDLASGMLFPSFLPA